MSSSALQPQDPAIRPTHQPQRQEERGAVLHLCWPYRMCEVRDGKSTPVPATETSRPKIQNTLIHAALCTLQGDFVKAQSKISFLLFLLLPSFKHILDSEQIIPVDKPLWRRALKSSSPQEWNKMRNKSLIMNFTKSCLFSDTKILHSKNIPFLLSNRSWAPNCIIKGILDTNFTCLSSASGNT